MSKIEVYNQKAEVTSSLELPDQFKIKTNPKLLTQAILFEKSREIVSGAHVKNRGEVRGGGKKPWKQKGTGRARAGSTRSPLWRTGGVTFAVQRSFKKNLPAKMHKKATFMILSQKFADKNIRIVQELKLEKIQTKFLEQFFKLFNLEKKPILMILKKMDEKIRKSARNLANLELIYPQNLQMKNLLNSKYVVMDLATFEILKEWGKNLK